MADKEDKVVAEDKYDVGVGMSVRIVGDPGRDRIFLGAPNKCEVKIDQY